LINTLINLKGKAWKTITIKWRWW